MAKLADTGGQDRGAGVAAKSRRRASALKPISRMLSHAERELDL